MKRRIWISLLGIGLFLVLSLIVCMVVGFLSTNQSQDQDPPIPHITRQDRGWIDPTGRVKASTLEALRHESDIVESEGFQMAGVFFSDVVSDPSKIAADFGNENGIGSANKDNGLVILVLLDRQGTDGNKPYIFVATGKGLEGLLNDAKVTRFREAYFNPLRSQGQWEQGLVQLGSKFAEYLKDPEAQAFSDASLGQQAQSQLQPLPWFVWVLLAAWVAILGVSLFGALKQRRAGGPGSSPGPWDSGSSGSSSYGGGGSFGGGGSGG